MSTYGYNRYEKIGGGIQVSADGQLEQKAGGITIDWGAITAASVDAEIRPAGETINTNFLSSASPADDYITAGDKYIRYGTVVCRISGGTSAGKFAPYGSTSIGGGTLLKTKGNMYILNRTVKESDYNSDHGGEAFDGGLVWRNRLVANFATVQTITISATGGTFTITYKGQTTSALAYNASAATVEAALVALSTIGTGNAAVALSGAVYTITLAAALGVHEAFTTNAASLTGGSQTATVATAADTTAGPTQTEFDAAFPVVRFVLD